MHFKLNVLGVVIRAVPQAPSGTKCNSTLGATATHVGDLQVIQLLCHSPTVGRVTPLLVTPERYVHPDPSNPETLL